MAYLGGERPARFALSYRDGPPVELHLEQPAYAWTLTVRTTGGLRTASVDPSGLYPPFLRAFLAHLRGEPTAFSVAAALEAVLVHLAARQSRARGVPVRLDEIPADAGFDGASSVAEYAAEKRRSAGP